MVRFNDISKLVKFREFWIMVRYAALHLKFGENVKNPIIQGNVNFIGERSSRAYSIDIVLLIKDRVGTMRLKFLVFILRGGVY